MSEYSRNIERLAKDKSSEIFYNSCEDHALVVLKNIIKHATTYVKSICGNMCSEISSNEEYLSIVDKFLSENEGRIFYILFDDYNENFMNKPIIQVISKYPKQVKIRKLKKGHIYYDGNPIHLTVSDDRAFRLETDIEKRMAWGNFKDPDNALVFSSAFDRFFTDEYSERILLSPNSVC